MHPTSTPTVELAAIILTAAPLLATVIIRLVLCALAVSATRKALEIPANGQADPQHLQEQRLTVLRLILATLTSAAPSSAVGKAVERDRTAQYMCHAALIGRRSRAA
jgi:hypothetical protein